MSEGVDGLHVRLSCGFVLNDERLLGRSDAAQALFVYLEALALSNRREFLPPEYGAKVLACRRRRGLKTTLKALDSLLDGERPLVGKLPGGRLRVIGVRKKHGARFRWKDERPDAELWNREREAAEDPVEVESFAPIEIEGRPKNASKRTRNDRKRQETNVSGTRSERGTNAERTRNERSTGTGTVTDTETGTETPAAAPPSRAERSSRVQEEPVAEKPAGPGSPPPARPGATGVDPTNEIEEFPSPPGWDVFRKGVGSWNGDEREALSRRVLVRARKLAQRHDGCLIVLGHFHDVAKRYRLGKLKRPWAAMDRKLLPSNDDAPRPADIEWAKLMVKADRIMAVKEKGEGKGLERLGTIARRAGEKQGAVLPEGGTV